MTNSTVLRTAAAAGTLAGSLLLAGCGASANTAPPAAAATSPTGAASAASAGTTEAAVQPLGATPPDQAAMVCSQEIRSRIVASLHLAADPATDSTWADGLFTCTYHLPDGPFPVSVKVLPSADAARASFRTQKAALPGAQDTGGMGEQAAETDGGMILAQKDNFVLRVDATALPPSLGAAPTQEQPIDLATVVARSIFDCWAGDGQ